MTYVLKGFIGTISIAVGADIILITFVKYTLSETFPVITAIFNLSLIKGNFPKVCKPATVNDLLPKLQMLSLHHILPPISLLPCPGLTIWFTLVLYTNVIIKINLDRSQGMDKMRLTIHTHFFLTPNMLYEDNIPINFQYNYLSCVT